MLFKFIDCIDIARISILMRISHSFHSWLFQLVPKCLLPIFNKIMCLLLILPKCNLIAIILLLLKTYIWNLIIIVVLMQSIIFNFLIVWLINILPIFLVIFRCLTLINKYIIFIFVLIHKCFLSRLITTLNLVCIYLKFRLFYKISFYLIVFKYIFFVGVLSFLYAFRLIDLLISFGFSLANLAILINNICLKI